VGAPQGPPSLGVGAGRGSEHPGLVEGSLPVAGGWDEVGSEVPPNPMRAAMLCPRADRLAVSSRHSLALRGGGLRWDLLFAAVPHPAAVAPLRVSKGCCCGSARCPPSLGWTLCPAGERAPAALWWVLPGVPSTPSRSRQPRRGGKLLRRCRPRPLHSTKPNKPAPGRLLPWVAIAALGGGSGGGAGSAGLGAGREVQAGPEQALPRGRGRFLFPCRRPSPPSPRGDHATGSGGRTDGPAAVTGWSAETSSLGFLAPRKGSFASQSVKTWLEKRSRVGMDEGHGPGRGQGAAPVC